MLPVNFLDVNMACDLGTLTRSCDLTPLQNQHFKMGFQGSLDEMALKKKKKKKSLRKSLIWQVAEAKDPELTCSKL